jgi:hypothetical protein
MTQRTRKPFPFSSTTRRHLVAEFSGGSITSDAGLLLLREADRQIGLLEALDAAIPDPRHPFFITHPQRTLLAQRIFGIACGYEDLNDHQHLRDDPLWQAATDHPGPDDAPTLASAPTLCRLENRIDRPTLVRLAAVLVEQFLASFATPPEHLTLDFDATDDPIHGDQEHRFFHGYYDGYCFLPLYVFCGSQLLAAYLRPANSGADHHAAAILKLLVTRLRQVWPDVRITIRGDSGFGRWRLMRWCDAHDVRYVLGLARNAVLERAAAEWLDQVRTAYALDGQSHRVYGTLSYAAKSWDRPRRVIVKAEHLRGPDGGKSNPRFLATNCAGDPRALYEDYYCPRGDMENRIKEQQLGLFADRTSCHAFAANQFRVLLAAAAYVLCEHVRRTALVGSELERAEVGTIRLRLFRVGALVQKTVRRIVVRIAAGFPGQDLFRRVAARLRRTRHTLDTS